jgi:hypothetical protein
MEIPNEVIDNIPKRLEWRCQNKEKSTIMGHFWGIFRIFRGVKGTPYEKTRKFYLLDISSTHQSR